MLQKRRQNVKAIGFPELYRCCPTDERHHSSVLPLNYDHLCLVDHHLQPLMAIYLQAVNPSALIDHISPY